MVLLKLANIELKHCRVKLEDAIKEKASNEVIARLRGRVEGVRTICMIINNWGKACTNMKTREE